MNGQNLPNRGQFEEKRASDALVLHAIRDGVESVS